MRATYIPNKNDTLPRPNRIDFGSGAERSRSIDDALEMLTEVSSYSDYIHYSPLGHFHYGRTPYRLARYIFQGLPQAMNQSDSAFLPQSTAMSLRERGHWWNSCFGWSLSLNADADTEYSSIRSAIPRDLKTLTRHTRRGCDLSLELWNGSKQPEAYYLERELGVLQFHGIVNLRSVADSNGIRARVPSGTLAKALVEPALKAAGRFLPRGDNREGAQIIPATTVGRNRYEGELGNPAELKPAPFEITIETPRKAPPELQTKAATAALNKIIEEYRSQPSL